MTTLYTLSAVLFVSLLSFLGIFFFLFEEKTIRQLLLYFVSLSTGALLGDVFIHIIPDLAESQDTFGRSLYILLSGILFSFVLEKIVHWRHCHVLPSETHHDHHHHPMGIVSIVGESMHNFIDGLVIAAAFLASIPIGVSTTIAVVLHEIPHEVGNVAILLHSGYSKKRALLLNCLSGVTSIVGALIVLLFAATDSNLVAFILPFAAGNLLYIAGSDLIPELHKETALKKTLGQLFCIIVGMVMMYGLKFIE
ncbi:ZIP family metal transporter [Candidatus Peribacteria bacterium]|nr:ZIP family metal transporter [Candidatus Peribacteria bacterium]